MSVKVLRVLLLTELSPGAGDSWTEFRIHRYVEKFKASGDHIADSTQRTRRTPNFEQPRNPEDDHQSTMRYDDRNPGVSSNRSGPVVEPSSFDPLSTSSSAHVAVAVHGPLTSNYDHKNNFSPEPAFRRGTVVDINSLDIQVRDNHWILCHDPLINMWHRITLAQASNNYMKPSTNIEKR